MSALERGGSSNPVGPLAWMVINQAWILLLAETKSAELSWSLEWSSRHKGVSKKTKHYHISPQKQFLRAEVGAPKSVQLTLSGEGRRKAGVGGGVGSNWKVAKPAGNKVQNQMSQSVSSKLKLPFPSPTSPSTQGMTHWSGV